jgi:hypothetical protein
MVLMPSAHATLAMYDCLVGLAGSGATHESSADRQHPKGPSRHVWHCTAQVAQRSIAHLQAAARPAHRARRQEC